LEAEAALVNNLPRGRSQAIKSPGRAQVLQIGAGAAQSPELTPDGERIRKLAWAIDGMMPNHRLSEDTILAAATAVELAMRGYGKTLVQEFAARTTLKPGTIAYNRAEFRNVIYALYQWACAFNQGSRAPAQLALYWFYSSAGAGPHPDRDFWQKREAGIHEPKGQELDARVNAWKSHLRNRIVQVRKALNPGSDLSEQRRRSILGEDPLIADVLPETFRAG
jgi:hypothetical protein